MRSVYRMFDAEGALLYVGCTGNFPQRLDTHRTTQPWWADVANVTVEHFEDDNTALWTEGHAISTEAPAHNVVGLQPWAVDAWQRFQDAETYPLALSDIAAHLGVSIGTIRRWIKDRQLSCVVTPRGHIRFSEADLADFIARGRRESEQEPAA